MAGTPLLGTASSPTKASTTTTPAAFIAPITTAIGGGGANDSTTEQNSVRTSTGALVSNVSLPSPALFDILPALHELLTRLLPVESDANSDTANTAFPGRTSLEIQNLATEAGAVRAKIQKAKAAVLALPDIERTIEEQEEEIRYLEEKIENQREVLRNFVSEKDAGGDTP